MHLNNPVAQSTIRQHSTTAVAFPNPWFHTAYCLCFAVCDGSHVVQTIAYCCDNPAFCHIHIYLQCFGIGHTLCFCRGVRSEEHTSELQSRDNIVCCL